jgi:hypothetical protein
MDLVGSFQCRTTFPNFIMTHLVDIETRGQTDRHEETNNCFSYDVVASTTKS